MAIGIRILSNNLSGQTTNVTYFPDTGGTIDLGTQVFPFNYISSYYYGDYDCYVPTYGYNYIVNVPGPTPTPSPTETQTNITPTPSETPIETPTETPTNTPSETPTETPSETPTETPTETPSETPTETPSETPTETPSETPTNTPTETPTETPSETPTNTPTETPTETPSETPTETPTPTITPTQPLDIFNITSGSTPNIACFSGLSGVLYGENLSFDTNIQFYNNSNGTVSGDMSGFYSYDGLVVELDSLGFETGAFSSCSVIITPTQTPTNTETPTNTPTNTETPTQTPTNTETPTQTPTNTETPTQTPTNTETPTETPTNTPSETPTETPTPTPTETPTETPTPTPTETPTNTPSETPTQTPTNTETPTQTPTNTITPSVTPSVTQSPVPSIITSGLILQLDANSNISYPGSGTTIYDLTGTYNHTITFTPFTILNGIKCFNNDTLTGQIQVNGTGPLLPNSGYTYITWAKIKPSSGDFRTLFKTNPNDHPIMVNIGTNDLGFYDNSATSFVDSGYDVTPILDVWVQYSVVGDSSSSIFYINGTQVGTTAAGAGGNRHQYWGFEQTFGYLANCYLYDRKLTLGEITEQYNFLAPRFIEITPTATNTQTPTPTPTL